MIALAPAGSQIAQYVVDQPQVDDRHVDDRQVERHEQHDRRHEQRREHEPGQHAATRGRRTDRAKPAVVATTIWATQDPNAITTVLSR